MQKNIVTLVAVTAWALLCVRVYQKNQPAAWVMVALAAIVVPLATVALKRRGSGGQ